MMQKRQVGLINGGVISIGEVFAARSAAYASATLKKASLVNFNGHDVKICSSRYSLFQTKGTDCVACGLKGQYFRLERFPADKTYHLNLYAIDEEGDEVLFTKDHIIPKAHGGKNSIANYQTMCSPCNAQKADIF